MFVPLDCWNSQVWRNAFEWVGDMSDALKGSKWQNSKFDVVAVDGLGNRVKMARAAATRLAPGACHCLSMLAAAVDAVAAAAGAGCWCCWCYSGGGGEDNNTEL